MNQYLSRVYTIYILISINPKYMLFIDELLSLQSLYNIQISRYLSGDYILSRNYIIYIRNSIYLQRFYNV